MFWCCENSWQSKGRAGACDEDKFYFSTLASSLFPLLWSVGTLGVGEGFWVVGFVKASGLLGLLRVGWIYGFGGGSSLFPFSFSEKIWICEISEECV